MATCKDCIHFEACKSCWCAFWERQEMTEDDRCKMFKDKARFIELPCKVGDTVYFSAEGYHDSAEIDGIHIDENGIVFSWVQYEVGVDITEVWDDGEFDIDEIGKTVFLTIEEAEKALAEKKEGVDNG